MFEETLRIAWPTSSGAHTGLQPVVSAVKLIGNERNKICWPIIHTYTASDKAEIKERSTLASPCKVVLVGASAKSGHVQNVAR